MNSPALEKELTRLKQQHPSGDHLHLIWLPGEARYNERGHRLNGEIQSGKTIFIYVRDPQQAKEVLRHEFLEFLICRSNQPYLEVINQQNRTISRLLYLLREKQVNRILDPTGILDEIAPKPPVKPK